jgi:aminoglycoside phosphotransferase (APT) family kinase protein
MRDELRLLVQARLDLEVQSVVSIEQGWDSSVYEVNGEWIVRVPRRLEVRDRMRKEAALLPLLGATLPVPIPHVSVTEDTAAAFFVAYPKLPGDPLRERLRRGPAEERLGTEAGVFLAALHAFPRSTVLRAGIPDVSAADWLADQRAFAKRCENDVTPLLTPAEREQARAMFAEFFSRRPDELETALIHGDLGPEHILCRNDVLSGVIDWSDARIGDPALDFAWLLYGTGELFGDAVLRAYAEGAGSTDDDLPARALFFHRLGPWHEVLHGLEFERPELVTTGLGGVRARLPDPR